MEREEQVTFTFYNPEVPKVKGNRNYRRVRQYPIVGSAGRINSHHDIISTAAPSSSGLDGGRWEEVDLLKGGPRVS